jgi:putative membrane protein
VSAEIDLKHPDEAARDIDYRFSLANERTYLAWIRTALALIIGGLAAAKGLSFHREWARWAVAGPPILAGTALAIEAAARWQIYERAMRAGEPLPLGRRLRPLAIGVCAYALVAFVAIVLDR